MADGYVKRPRLFEEERGGLAFREVFTPLREDDGPLPERPRRSGRGGSSITHGVTPPVGSVWSASDAAANGMTLSNGGLTVINPTVGSYETVRGTISHTTGKYYVEFKTSTGATGASSEVMFGLADAGFAPVGYLGASVYSAGCDNQSANFVSAGFTANYVMNIFPIPANDVFAIAVDLAAGKLWVAHNNAWVGTGNPASGANPMVTIAAPALGLALFPGLTSLGPNGGQWTLQPTAASQTYTPPAGFSAWG